MDKSKIGFYWQLRRLHVDDRVRASFSFWIRFFLVKSKKRKFGMFSIKIRHNY